MRHAMIPQVNILKLCLLGTKRVMHLNNAGSSLPPNPVLQVTQEYLFAESVEGGYEVAEAREAQLNLCYTALARLLNCDASDRILTCSAEYGSNYIAFLQVSKRFGVVVEVIPDDEHGQLDIAKLQLMIDDSVKLIAISHIPTSSGLVNPAAAVGKIARASNIPYLLDACQSVGQMPLDVHQLGCNFLTGTSRKYLRGPRGAGFLYVRA
eukprot:gene2213-2923_t